MDPKRIILIGAPIETGASQAGCLMGPDAFRTAGLAATLRDLGHSVEDRGNLSALDVAQISHPNTAIHDLEATVGWAMALEETTYNAMSDGLPIILGGDHSLAVGSVPAVARAAQDADVPQFVLWLDAHPDIHTLSTTASGNLHGTPVAYFIGMDGFEEIYPPLKTAIAPENICMMGIRSVDADENEFLAAQKVEVHDMRAIDEHGIAPPLRRFLKRVADANGALHVSLDVDFLDPGIAPGVGTTVPGGATFREAHLVMEMLCDSALVTSLDLVELNPFLDERGRTANLMVDLCASLMGRKVLDRPTRSF